MITRECVLLYPLEGVQKHTPDVDPALWGEPWPPKVRHSRDEAAPRGGDMAADPIPVFDV
jgi:hypothetical protein